MFNFLKDVGKEILDESKNDGRGQQPQGQHGAGQDQYGSGQGQYGGGQGQYGGGQGQYGGGQGQYGGDQGQYGGGQSQYGGGQGQYGGGQGQYGGGQGQYGGGQGQGQYGGQDQYGGGQGQYGGQGQQGGQSGGGGGDMLGMASNMIGGMLSGGGKHGGQGGSSGGGGSDMGGIISGIGGMLSGGGQQQSQPQGDLVNSAASAVIANLFSGNNTEDAQNMQQKTGLTSGHISTIVGNVVSNLCGQQQQGGGGATGGFNSSMIATVTSSVIREIMKQDDGRIMPTNDADKNSATVTNIATNVVSSIISGRSGSGGSGGGGGLGNQMMAGMASQYIGNMLSGGGNKQQGGSIASNIIGAITRSQAQSTRDDGTVDEHLTSMRVDPSKKRILPGAGSMISSMFNRGAYHLRNRLRKGGKSGTGDVINPAKAVFNFGERGSGLKSRGQDIQDFESLRANCQEEGRLFEDPDFPAEDISIFFSKSPPRPFEWKRPHEVTDDPQLFIDGASRFDVKQGELGDCWLLAAVANLTLNRRLFYQIVPSDQGFGDNYAGIFHFRFWQYGRWVDVVVDDRLPTFSGKLVFMHSADRNEFWSALLEKAYAKLHGSYEALKGGTTCEAMEDFTGGVSELYDLTKAPPNLFNIMLKAYERGSLMGCSLEPDPNEVEARCDNGLIRGHAYSITCAKYCEIQTPSVSGKIPLVRIRNPWGNEAEWTGPWSDQSQEWQYIPQEQKEEMGLTFEHDGEFWMAYKDFVQEFGTLEMTNLSPDSLSDDDVMQSVQHKWEMSVYEGAWIRGSTAGGCRNYIQSFWHNPQYRITLTEVDDDDQDNKCTVIVACMQKNRRSQRKLGLECLTIGFAIYHLRDSDSLPRPLDMNFFKYNASVARSPSFINMREVSCRFKLPPGTYCIVPSTFEPQDEGEFILRVFSEKSNEMEENDEEVGFGQVDERVQPQSQEDEAEADERIKGFFAKVAGDDLEIDWSELQNVLNFAMKREFTFDGFSKDVSRSMISMMDVDRSGKLGLREFIRLWTDIRTWKNAFKLHDTDQSSFLSNFELRQALNSAGYRLNNHICNALMLRYGDKDGNVSFDDFIMCSVKLRTMMGNPASAEPPTDEEIDAFYASLMEEVQAKQVTQEQAPEEDVVGWCMN